MGDPVFYSVFAQEMKAYLDLQVSFGWKERSYLTTLRLFDRFCIEQGIGTLEFTKEHAATWVTKRDSEATTTHYSRVNTSKQFLAYLSKKGYDVFVVRDVKFTASGFQPHIFTDDEINRYFTAADEFASSYNRKDAIQYPILFRLLYCCGMRINEALGVRKRDVDLDTGIIKLFETKNDCERLIVLGVDMKCLMRQFADKCFYLIDDNGYIFTTSNGSRLSGEKIYWVHREFLRRAGIPFLGDSLGPRVHDWRHTMAVRSFKQIADMGMDMYVALPILSAYLGHKTIYATERYVRLTMSIYPYIEERFGSKADEVFRKAVIYEED